MTPELNPVTRLVPFSDLVGFARVVREMRQSQAQYFDAAKRSPTGDRSTLLRTCRNWERQVDTRVREIITALEFSTPSMFGDDGGGPGVTPGELIQWLERAIWYIEHAIEIGRLRPASFAGDPAFAFPEDLRAFIAKAKGGGT